MQQAPETMEIAEAEHATRVEHGAVPDDAEAFWSDVFVHQGGLPWRRFVQSGACHAAAILVIWAGPAFGPFTTLDHETTRVHTCPGNLLHAFRVFAAD